MACAEIRPRLFLLLLPLRTDSTSLLRTDSTSLLAASPELSFSSARCSQAGERSTSTWRTNLRRFSLVLPSRPSSSMSSLQDMWMG